MHLQPCNDNDDHLNCSFQASLPGFGLTTHRRFIKSYNPQDYYLVPRHPQHRQTNNHLNLQYEATKYRPHKQKQHRFQPFTSPQTIDPNSYTITSDNNNHHHRQRPSSFNLNHASVNAINHSNLKQQQQNSRGGETPQQQQFIHFNPIPNSKVDTNPPVLAGETQEHQVKGSPSLLTIPKMLLKWLFISR